MLMAMKLMLGLGLVLAASTPGLARAGVKSEPLDYKQGDATLKGFIAYDDAAKGPVPGIVVVTVPLPFEANDAPIAVPSLPGSPNPPAGPSSPSSPSRVAETTAPAKRSVLATFCS